MTYSFVTPSLMACNWRFMDVNPDPALTLDITVPYTLPGAQSHLLFLSRKLSRKHLMSMARIHLIPPQTEKPHYVRAPRYCFTFRPIAQCRIVTSPETPWTMIAPFLGNARRTRRYSVPCFPKETLVPNHFTPDFLQDLFIQEHTPKVYIISRLPARVLFWRWWEPKF
ncbi:hypothetical protein BDV93DRAFT_301279 [Ceratobasidium sp. AG-I]|nr:hypothetical protein BDV93DRAFT_301279 [Ceratobasidium sp. AG-I]